MPWLFVAVVCFNEALGSCVGQGLFCNRLHARKAVLPQIDGVGQGSAFVALELAQALPCGLWRKSLPRSIILAVVAISDFEYDEKQKVEYLIYRRRKLNGLGTADRPSGYLSSTKCSAVLHLSRKRAASAPMALSALACRLAPRILCRHVTCTWVPSPRIFKVSRACTAAFAACGHHRCCHLPLASHARASAHGARGLTRTRVATRGVYKGRSTVIPTQRRRASNQPPTPAY